MSPSAGPWPSFQAGVLMPDVNEDFVAIAKKEGWYSDHLMRRIAEAGHIEGGGRTSTRNDAGRVGSSWIGFHTPL